MLSIDIRFRIKIKFKIRKNNVDKFYEIIPKTVISRKQTEKLID